MTAATLEARRLEYGYGEPLFRPLDFACAPGEVCAILGANGRGKTTLLHTLAGVLPALGGEVRAMGGIGFVPQRFTPTFSYRVFDIVLMGRAGHVGLLHMPSRRDEAITLEALDALGIGALAQRAFPSLSGGQQQLVLIARALATRSNILVLDEPMSALDLFNQQAVMRLIRRLAGREGVSVLFTTHDPSHASLLADNTLLLLPGREWLHGATRTVLSEENLKRAYDIVVKRVDVDHQGRRHRILVPLFDPRD
ncbi:ABC transporter ATP-binding protein [Acerihabitans arboris]|uniref:ATP-binding cassette domain-containing protein n=1 Tax=Acerihabitans arboris TaxID=2691583 RepID=A0A845SKG8_9GAMM|nr:ABC transporter ATP-binding protein [Acerihabitans arboris]NDL63454.1 ATP-binding cassette domain-containing protein [Acerihabitans arboris]